jgi:hypothetical protein
MQVFLSYDQSDEAFAKSLSSHLERLGLSVWSPHDEVLPGDNAWLRIGEALEKSSAMVVLVSPDSMRSDHVRRDIEYALGDPNFEGRLFPVQVRPTPNLPSVLRKLKTFDARRSIPQASRMSLT